MVYIIVILGDFDSDKYEKGDVTSKNARLVELETMDFTILWETTCWWFHDELCVVHVYPLIT